jgi:hypothetical protein
MAGKSADIPVNPVLMSVMQAGGNNAITFRGYVGPSSADAYISVYPSLDDLSQSVEISKSDILGFADLPDSVMPLGAKIIWVKNSAIVTRRGAATLQGTIPNQQADVREVGRLRMQVRSALQREGETCQSRCSVCQSRCSVCHSRCSARRF